MQSVIHRFESHLKQLIFLSGKKELSSGVIVLCYLVLMTKTTCTSRMSQNESQSIHFSHIFWGGMPPDPPSKGVLTHTLLYNAVHILLKLSSFSPPNSNSCRNPCVPCINIHVSLKAYAVLCWPFNYILSSPLHSKNMHCILLA